MTKVRCCVCTEEFAISDDTYAVFKRSHQTFYCPFGHGQHFTEFPEVEKPSAEVLKFPVIDGDKS